MIEDNILQVFKGKVVGNNVLIKTCPFCGNKKSNLEISLIELPKYGNKRVFNCWNCNTSGTLEGFCKKFNIPFDDDRKYLQVRQQKYNVQLDITNAIEFPKEFKLINTENPISIYEKNALAYLYSRGIQNDTIKRFNIGYCENGNYESRIVFPIYENGELIYFTTRGYWLKEKAKPLHPTGTKRHILFNYSRVYEGIILVEAVLDALSVIQCGYNGVALLGKSIYPEQVQKLLLGNLKTIYILLDSETKISERKAIYNKLNVPGIELKIINLPESDPNSYNQKKLKELLDKHHLI
jgi:DNA primase